MPETRDVMLRSIGILSLVVAGCVSRTPTPLPLVRPNDNLVVAGTRNGDTVSLQLVAQRAEWRPAGDSLPGIPIAAFAEEGGQPSNPGPLIRVPLGTHLRVSLRNTLADTLVFCQPFQNECAAADTLRILPGATATREFTADRLGLYQYGAFRLAGSTVQMLVQRHQLAGALVVDPATAPPPHDRIFVITSWTKTDDDLSPFVQGINGRTWPTTERFDVTVGDSLRWRWLNTTDTPHPMHLHGFYFRLLGRGDNQLDTLLTPDRQPLEVTEEVVGSAAIVWSPTRPGNWLFHCHKAAHMSVEQLYHLAGAALPDSFPMHDGPDHVLHDMGGLILAISAAPAQAAVAGQDVAPRAGVRLAIQERRGYYGDANGLGFVVEAAGSPVAPDSITIPGPVLQFVRGQPAQVTIVNRLRTPTTVHWHGIEVDSYYDGIAGWSGTRGSLAPMIAPGDSFVARFTPPRSGTFMYHAHLGETRQLNRGMYGPIIVHEPGQPWDPRIDHVLMITQGGPSDTASVVVNGKLPADTVFLARGRTNRLRLINLTMNDDAVGTLTARDSVVPWRVVAKDGADLPRALQALRPAKFLFGPGEIFDAEVDGATHGRTLHIVSFNTFDIPLVTR